MKSKKRKSGYFWGLLLILGLAFAYRLYGLGANHSFWTDEGHVAIFVRAILERGQPVLANGYDTGVYQWLWYWLGAFSAQIFGLNELALRLSSVIFGVLTVGVIYLVGKTFFNQKVGLVAAFLTAFLTIEILWSRQARPYQALQFFFLLSAYFSYRFIQEKKFSWRFLIGFLICGASASLIHGLGLLIFINGFLVIGILSFPRIKALFFKYWWLGILMTGLLVMVVFSFWGSIRATFYNLGDVNNLFYYRVFLQHNYFWLSLLAMIGLIFSILKKRKAGFILILPLITQLLLVSFVLLQPFVRYFYLVFAFIILFTSVGLDYLSGQIIKTASKFLPLKTSLKNQYSLLALVFLLILTISFSKAKFSFLPQRVYSLNNDMQELPEVDWKEVYDFVEDKLLKKEVVLITNWNDHAVWFLGEGKLDYLLRQRERFSVQSKNDPLSGAEFLGDLTALKLAIEKHPKGIVILDSWDDRVPQEARQYIRSNLKKELEVDRLYLSQPRYWPVEVYSWGLD